MSRKKRPKAPNPFQQAVLNTPGLGGGAYCPGLRALTNKHRARVKPGEVQILGSVNIEQALHQRYPNKPIWDYAIGVQKGSKPYAIWVEVHPANTSNVSEVLSKLRWLKEWLSGQATQLHALTPPQRAYHWIATDGVHITPDSPKVRQLAQAGLTMPREVLKLNELEL
jgi:hypothetical protein